MPNRVDILFDCVMQVLESGRDTIYHLSGPQMTGYIKGIERSLSKAYDCLLAELPDLPETLYLKAVPVAECRFLTHQRNAADLQEVERTIAWYEELPNEGRRYAQARFSEVARAYPSFFRSIEDGDFMSQYDITGANDLAISDWMMHTPLSRVAATHKRFAKGLG